MKADFVVMRQRLHFFSAYAPQISCPVAEKEVFWNMLDEETAELGKDELIIVAED